MRHIGTLKNPQDADRLKDYLLTIGIKSSIEADGNALAVWVYDEDNVEAARQALAAFVANPHDERFAGVSHKAAELRHEQAEQEQQARENIVSVRSRWNRPLLTQCPVSICMIALCIFVGVNSKFGKVQDPYITALSIEAYSDHFRPPQELSEVRKGEVWRLVTPIFIHFGVPHLLFNMMWLYELGLAIEARISSLRFLLLVLAIAIVSNFSQYLMSGPNFGGMSGVVYGLFGYIWMKGYFHPASGFFMPRNLVVLMIGWFFLCLTGAIGPIANTAHGVGLVVGMAAGLLSAASNQFLRR